MRAAGIHADRVARLLSCPRVREKKPPREVGWPIAHPAPPDVEALYAACDGLLLEDGVRLFGKGELGDTTQWLILEKGLGWPDDLLVIGERRDVVIVLDLDTRSARAGGGVLEAGSDDLEALERVASGVVSYLLVRAGAGDDAAPPPEVAARRAATAGDPVALEHELARPMYPGHGRLLASLAIDLGGLWAAAGDAGRAMSAFARAVDARIASVGRGAREAERVAAWLAAGHGARARGAEAIALACEARAQM
jgi:hypothetical protein